MSDKVEIIFTHIATKKSARFLAWITDFSDNYSSNWNSENLFGRMDPMMTFQNTQRTISLAWDTVAASQHEAEANMNEAQKFIQLLYPTYEKGHGGAAMIAAPPLIRVEFVNWIGSRRGGGNGGLICALNGTSYQPALDVGLFWDSAGGKLVPKTVSFSTELTVLHEHLTGWTTSGEFGKGFEPSGTPGPGGEEVAPQGKEVSAPEFPYGVKSPSGTEALPFPNGPAGHSVIGPESPSRSGSPPGSIDGIEDDTDPGSGILE